MRSAHGTTSSGVAATPQSYVVLLGGPSGSGKSRIARASGLPILNLDDFYKEGTDPSLPRHRELGIVDWDDPRSWDADRAMTSLTTLAFHGSADVPVYDIATDRATHTRCVELDGSPVFIAEGIFASELVDACRQKGILADAIVVRRAPWKNFLRRLVRDLSERRKSPVTLLRRGWGLMRAETAGMRRQTDLGARPCDAEETARRLSQLRSGRNPA